MGLFVRVLVCSPHANEERHEPVALDLVRQELPEGELVPVDRRHRRSSCDTLLLLLGLSLPLIALRLLACVSLDVAIPPTREGPKKETG